MCREMNQDRDGGEMGTENSMDKKPGQGTARIWLNSYCKAVQTQKDSTNRKIIPLGFIF